jgi:metal-dependent amidase/aminoacylase/carboxypeptidase family protein
MVKRIQDVVKGTEISFDVSATLENIEGYPVLINDSELVKHMNRCAGELLGEECVHSQPPSMGAEDFAYFCEKWGGLMIHLGCHDPQKGFQYSLHSPYFDIDERVLDVGTQLFGYTLTRYLETP